MVGSILSRVIPSRFKMTINQACNEPCNEEANYSLSQHHSDINFVNTAEIMAVNSFANFKPQVPYDDRLKSHFTAGNSKIPVSSRKHSYASVNEDSGALQSFRSRRLLSDSSPRLSECSTRRPSFDVDIVKELEEYSNTDEDVVIDEDLEIGSVGRTGSTSNGSIPSTSKNQPASLETMPDELLDLIFSLITMDASQDRYINPRVDLCSCLQVSKPIHAAALRVLYRHVKIPQSKAFFKFTNSLAEDTQLGELVQYLDFSHLSGIGFGRTRTTHTAVPYLTPSTLKACLDKTPNLKAFLATEHVDEELDAEVLSKLFSMPSMRAIDLCACSSKLFVQTITSVSTDIALQKNAFSSVKFLQIERLSLHECTTLRPLVFEALLPRLARLTHLDVAHTMIGDTALMSIAKTAHITHLNLERCTQITGAAVVKFITQHPAIIDSIQYLNLMADASRYRLLSEDDLDDLLPALPQCLRSLNIGGTRANSTHVQHLRRLATHLEELGLKGADLSLGSDITCILSLNPGDNENEMEHPEWRSSLRYIDLTDVKSVSKMSLTYSPTTITGIESVPLEVIELGPSVIKDLRKGIEKQKTPEWIITELGRRGWFVRDTNLLPKWLYMQDDGYRSWKMGTRWWGMRKLPMLDQATGGMYGYYMFKRN